MDNNETKEFTGDKLTDNSLPSKKTPLTPTLSPCGRGSRCAFTLAEVLITLGIIGIVAAMTLPTLIQNHITKGVETKLQKVYSVMNQAISQSELDNGEKEYWNFQDTKFVEKYFLPYMNVLKVEEVDGGNRKYAFIYFPDGSLLITKCSGAIQEDGTEIADTGGMFRDYFFYPNAKNYNFETFKTRGCLGKSCFGFRFGPDSEREINLHHFKHSFMPYKCDLPYDYSEEHLLSGSYACLKTSASPMYCTALIEYNGWKIPKNYSFKVK